MHKEVVLGGDVWDLLDELMIYMGNPMQYYERGVQFVRVIFSTSVKDKNSPFDPTIFKRGIQET